LATGGCPKRDGFPVILGVVQEKGEGGGGKVHLGQEQEEDAVGQHAEVDPGRKREADGHVQEGEVLIQQC